MIDPLLAATNPLDHVVQHTFWGVGEGPFSFPILSNHIVMQLIGAGLLIWLIPKAVQQRAGSDGIGRLVPRGFGNAIEATCVALRDVLIKPNLGKYADAFTPFIWSLFFFVLVSNVLGLVPLADWVGWIPFFSPGGHSLLGGTSTGNLWVTGALSAMVLFMLVYHGVKVNGLDYFKHFFMGPPGVNLVVGLIEIFGLFFKCMALAIRLFANMLAGHVLLAVLLGFVDAAWRVNPGVGLVMGVVVAGASVLVYFLEIFVAFLHAFIFTALTVVFLGMSINIHHEAHEEHGGHEHAGEHEHAVPAATPVGATGH